MRSFPGSLIVAGVVGLMMTLLAAVPVTAIESELEEDHELSMQFETPHTDWAQPYALGKVRLLYFGFGSYGRGIEARDLIELMQRFDIEAAAAYHHRIVDSSQVQWAGGDEGLARIARLLELPWDCFLFHGVGINALPAEAQYRLLKAVSEGAGLVLIGFDDERVLKPENKLSELPPLLANDPVGDVYEVMEGRAIRLPSRPQIPYRPGWEVDYDYWVERVGRAVLWAADKAPRVSLRIALETEQMERTEVPGQSVRVELSAADGPAKLKLEARLRRSDGAVFQLASGRAVRANAKAAFFKLPAQLQAGQYHIDIIARSKQGIEAWATSPLEVTASRTVEGVDLDNAWSEIGGRLAGTVKLTGEPVAGESVRVQLLDARQRILTQADRPVADSAASFEFGVQEWMPMLLEVRATVMDSGGEVASAYEYFHVTKRHRGQFNFVVWDYPKDTLAPYAEAQLARLGCTVQLSGGAPPTVLAANQIAWVPYTTRIVTTWDDNGYMKPICWNNEPAVDEWVEGIVNAHQASREHGVFVYSLGDEIYTTGSCVHPSCLAAYRRYLKQEYRDIAALNESWGSDYASFDEINLLVEGDNDELEALSRKLYPRWYDRQAFKGYNLVKLCERFGKRFNELDPEARTGFEGAGRFGDGTDIDLVCRTNGFWSPYPGTTDEVLRSIPDRDFIRSNWMGYSKDAERLLWKYWRMVTRGCDSVWWWRWDGFGRFRGLLAPHMAPWPAIKEMQQDTQVVRDGLGSLLLKCKREDDGIVILYSYPSTFANKLEAGPSYGTYEKEHQAWHTNLRALGLQFSYVTDRMLRLGEFRPWRYKLLILPQEEAIGPKEAAVIRSFVENGGTVIADVRPGIYDSHCKPLVKGFLDDLFGIERAGNEEASRIPATVEGKLAGREVAASIAEVIVDPAVRLTSGEPIGSADTVPLCIVNQVGEGHAVLLNFTMASFQNLSTEDTPQAAAEFVAALLDLGGVRPQVAVTDADGNPVRDTEVIRWRGRGVDFLTLFGGKDETVQVQLPRARHIYDLREHAYRGCTATFMTHKLPNRATFIALSRQALAAPQVQLSSRRVARGERLAVALSYPESRAWHAACLRVRQPDGTHAEWFDQVVIVGGDGTEVTLPIAHNDPAGLWTIRAIDLYTEEVAQVRVRVR